MQKKLPPFQQKILKWIEEHKGESFILLKNRGGGLSAIQKEINENKKL